MRLGAIKVPIEDENAAYIGVRDTFIRWYEDSLDRLYLRMLEYNEYIEVCEVGPQARMVELEAEHIMRIQISSHSIALSHSI